MGKNQGKPKEGFSEEDPQSLRQKVKDKCFREGLGNEACAEAVGVDWDTINPENSTQRIQAKTLRKFRAYLSSNRFENAWSVARFCHEISEHSQNKDNILRTRFRAKYWRILAKEFLKMEQDNRVQYLSAEEWADYYGDVVEYLDDIDDSPADQIALGDLREYALNLETELERLRAKNAKLDPVKPIALSDAAKWKIQQAIRDLEKELEKIEGAPEKLVASIKNRLTFLKKELNAAAQRVDSLFEKGSEILSFTPDKPAAHRPLWEKASDLRQAIIEGRDQAITKLPAGSEFRDHPSAPKMIVVIATSPTTPSTFKMGSDETSENGDAPSPEQIGQVSLPYAIAQTAVTVEEFRKFLSFRHRLDKNPSLKEGVPDGIPVYSLDWPEANAYCDWLSTYAAANYRLPVEVEWEYACSLVPESAARPDIPRDPADPPNLAVSVKPTETELSVGARARNTQLLDLRRMTGNVLEWCRDAWVAGRAAEKNQRQALDQAAQEQENSMRITRGATWSEPKTNALQGRTERNYAPSVSKRETQIGMRPVRILESQV